MYPDEKFIRLYYLIFDLIKAERWSIIKIATKMSIIILDALSCSNTLKDNSNSYHILQVPTIPSIVSILTFLSKNFWLN